MDSELFNLIDKRKKWVKSSKENKFDFDSILAGLYNDPSHFIYEILQNAEDEGAKEVRFEIFEDRLDIYHDGKDFDIEDIDGVTGIGISRKKDDLTSIGKFGVGFKSVFAITETPYIFSGEYRIKIEDFVIPSVVNSNEQVERTLIRLPFNHKLRHQEEIFALVSKKLENIGLKTLLFLKNIKGIKWQIHTSNSLSGHYSKSSEDFQKIPNAKKVTLRSSSVAEEYIVIWKPIKIEGENLTVEVAYKLGRDKNGKEIIVQEPDSKLVVFFPTEKVTFLNFVIQGPYKTTPNRENIPLEDKQNKAILEETANLVTESLSVIKDLGYLDTNFLSLLPINPKHKGSEQIYSVIYDKVKEKFLSEELLPSSDGKYTKANNSLLARGKELTEFLNKEDIQELFSKQTWLDTNITYDKTRELRDYLIDELKVTEVDFESFARKITTEFLQTKSDEWMIDFYSRLLDQQSLWSDRAFQKGILRTKPIIRLENNEHIAPFDDNGKVQVYLPTETKSKYNTVKRVFTKDENAQKFLEKLGLTKPDIFAEIRKFILPKYQTDNPVKDECYFDDFEKLLMAYERIPANKKNEFMEELSNASFIDSVKNDTRENYLKKPIEIYSNDPDLRAYFEGYQSVFFVSDELYERFGKKRLKNILIELGVENKPRRIEIEGNLSREEKSRLRGNSGCSYERYIRDYELEGLKTFIQQMTPQKSILLWKILLKGIGNLSSWEAKNYFEGEYRWFYYREHYKNFESKFLRLLKQRAWLIDRSNNLRKPSEITYTELSDSYNKESPNIDVLKKVLGFKPEIIEQLPEEDKKILEVTKEYGITAEELKKILFERNEKLCKEKKERWKPEFQPDAVPVSIQEAEPAKIVTPDLAGQEGRIGVQNGEKLPSETEKPEEKNVEKIRESKAIGEWGEEYVFSALKKKYQGQGEITETDSGFKVINCTEGEFEIIWLNKHQDKGKGYDFVIRKNGIEIEYIEVKTKKHEKEELIEVTGTQWEFARMLFEQNEGEKYYFYVVLNAGKENAQIHILKNPIKLWKEGKLYAHPVNFKL